MRHSAGPNPNFIDEEIEAQGDLSKFPPHT